MPGILSTDKTAINEFILKCAFYKRPVYDAYKKLCKKQQNPNIDYVDFEWKYYQFYHGNRDLTIEKSPKNSSPVTLSDLPMELLEKVLDKVEIIDRIQNSKSVVYRVNSRGKLDDFIALLESLNFQIQVEKFIIDSTTSDNLFQTILQYLKPGTLEEIILFKVPQNWEGAEQIVEMDQWKKALRFRSDCFPYGFPIEKLMHFKTISIGSTKITEERLAKIRDNLLKSTQFESLHLEMYNLREPGPTVDDFDRIMSQDQAYDLETRRFLIPNSQEYFEMSYKKKFISNSLYIHKVSD